MSLLISCGWFIMYLLFVVIGYLRLRISFVGDASLRLFDLGMFWFGGWIFVYVA